MNNGKMNWRDFFTGFAAGLALMALIMVCMVPGMLKDAVGSKPADAKDSTEEVDSAEETEDKDEAELKQYDTTIKDWEVTLSDSSTLHYSTPADWFSLADQYNDGLIQYYGKELPDTGIVCVGDNKDQYNATMIINARPLSQVQTVLETIYEDDFNAEEMMYSSTYTFMKDGTEPDDGSTVEELESIVSADGHTYRIFHHAFDTEYYTNEEQTETTTVHTDELLGYSDTEDAVEIIMYMAEFDQDAGIAKLKEFLGAAE